MIARRFQLPWYALGCTTLLLTCAFGPVVAQYDDPTLDDQEQQDRRYLERYRKQAEEPEEQPPADEEARAEAFIARGEELIQDKNYRSFGADRFRVQTDDPRVDPKAVAALLEGFRVYFSEFWSGTLELRPRENISRVFLFYSFYKYNQLLSGDWRFSDVRPEGHYVDGVSAITLHTDSAAASNLADVLVHETTHLLLDERVFTEGAPLPTWASEGLATYFGYTFMDDEGRFHAGEIGGKQVALMRDGKAVPGREAKQRLGSLKKMLKSKDEVAGLIDVIGTDARSFYSRPEWSYSAAWVLVHYLLHGEEGALRDGFARWLILESRGQGGPAALYRELGLNLEQLEAGATAHLKRLKAR